MTKEKPGSHILLDLLTVFAFLGAGGFWFVSWMMPFVTHEMVLILNSVVFLLAGILFQVSKGCG